MQPTRGLTLLELMLAVCILGTLSVAAIATLRSCEPAGADAFEEEDEEPGTYLSYEEDSSGRTVPVRRYTSSGAKVPSTSSKYPSMPKASPSPRPTPKTSPSPAPSPKSGSNSTTGSKK